MMLWKPRLKQPDIVPGVWGIANTYSALLLLTDTVDTFHLCLLVHAGPSLVYYHLCYLVMRLDSMADYSRVGPY